jgi:hypothetical protein
MLQKIKERIFPFLIALSALSISASAAFYSVTGLSMLFAGASTAVLIMASSLEVSKLVIASLLYQYWDTINKALRVYLTIATVILILLTSAGIYGYLSAAYQDTATKSTIVDQKIAALETKKKLYEQTRDNILKEKQSLTELRGTLSKGSTTQYTDKKGNLVVKSNNASFKQIEAANKSDEKLSAKLDVVNDSIFSLETKMLEIKTTAVGESELGPLKYLSQLTGVAMDRIINWYILVIIFVFDPLAISLVIAANFAFAQLIRREETPIEEKVEDMRKVVDAYDDLQEEIENHTPQSSGVPVMVDPKTGKFFYEDPEPEIEVKMSGEPSLKNLDLDGDGIVETEELQQVFDEADTNDDGYIDEKEAKAANLDPETTEKLNQLNKQVEGVVDNVKQYYNFNPEELSQINHQIEKIKKLSMELGSLKSKKEDDNTITYF